MKTGDSSPDGKELFMGERLANPKIIQITLPDPNDQDPHPRIRAGNRGIHAGETFTAYFPDGWHEITLEMDWAITGPACWYISTPGFSGVCPIGLFIRR